jgi:hypothetical protein
MSNYACIISRRAPAGETEISQTVKSATRNCKMSQHRRHTDVRHSLWQVACLKEGERVRSPSRNEVLILCSRCALKFLIRSATGRISALTASKILRARWSFRCPLSTSYPLTISKSGSSCGSTFRRFITTLSWNLTSRWMVSTPPYRESPGFKSRPEDRQPWLKKYLVFFARN